MSAFTKFSGATTGAGVAYNEFLVAYNAGVSGKPYGSIFVRRRMDAQGHPVGSAVKNFSPA